MYLKIPTYGNPNIYGLAYFSIDTCIPVSPVAKFCPMKDNREDLIAKSPRWPVKIYDQDK